MRRLPVWFKQEIPTAEVLPKLSLISQYGLHTVCQEAHCPNLNTCFKNAQLTFLILGDTCTRRCSFCAVKKASVPYLTLDQEEPLRIARIVKNLGLRYAVMTSVTRDDLADGGAGLFAQSIREIREINPGVKIEVLIPDFAGNFSSLKKVLAASPDVLGHNLETVERLYPQLRPEANYQRSLEILREAKAGNHALLTKSALMLGLGEKEEEIITTLKDLRRQDCDILTLGQYLAPSALHYPVEEFIPPDKFNEYQEIARAFGFRAVSCAPLVRSSYQAQDIYRKLTGVLCTK